MFLLLINNTDIIIINEDDKVIKNVKNIDIYYHHIQNLIKKKIIMISHISTDKMTADNLIKILLSNKFKKFIELIKILKIKISDDSEFNNDKFDDSEFNNNKTSNDKNDENFVTNYYKKTDEEISFKTEKTK